MMILADLSDQALTGRLLQIRKDERRLLVDCLGCLAELDRRKTVLSLGYGSLFSFCTEFLCMTKASAFRRTTAARLLARFPVVADYLADGRLNLTTLVELRDVLDEAHLVEILDRAAGRTEDQVKQLVASLRPQPAPADLLRRLPGPRNDSGGSGPAPPAANGPSAALAPPPNVLPPPATAVQVARPPAARLHPIAPQQHVLRVTVSAEFVADLEAARQALSHKLPGGELAEVLHEGLRAILTNADRRRRGAGKTSSPSTPPPGSRYVPAAVRGQVWRRDGGQCAFIGSTGHRCTSRHQLELHHLHPFALGGPPLATNLSLRCRAHNLHAAEQDYGRAHIAAKVAARKTRARSASTLSLLPGLPWFASSARATGASPGASLVGPGSPTRFESQSPLLLGGQRHRLREGGP
jgi:5-methylcytosine-specific restriction endonuclease McrA